MHELVEQYTQRPDIQSMVMRFILNHLWSHILERSTKSVPLLAVIRLNTPAEIADFDNVAFFDKDIFRFNISMNQTLFMHVINSRTDLDEKVECCILTQIFLFSYQVK